MVRKSLLIAITFHYLELRLKYLYEVLRSLSEFHGSDVHVIICCNVPTPPKLARILNALSKGRGRSFKLEVCCFSDLAHPFDLAWAHRNFIKDKFLNPLYEYSHFVYLEDDVRFSESNFLYFIRVRPQLREMRLIPSFIRVEFNVAEGFPYCSDVTGDAHELSSCNKVTFENEVLVALRTPYCGMFVLDLELADELVRSPMQDIVASKSVFPLDPALTRERAAAGLCWFNVPGGFSTRFVIPFLAPVDLPAAYAWIEHLPGNYTNVTEAEPDSHPWGRTPVDRIFGAGNVL